jgi:hypothetical protein
MKNAPPHNWKVVGEASWPLLVILFGSFGGLPVSAPANEHKRK